MTLIVEDKVELPEDPAQRLWGVTTDSWLALDRPDFFDRYTEALDQLSARMAIAVAPYRYEWLTWDAPLVQLPTGISLSPPRFKLPRPRIFSAPRLEQLDFSGFQSVSAGFESVSMSIHFYLRAAIETDRISRFFDAFRALESLSKTLHRSLRARAATNCTNSAAGQDKALEAFKQSGRNIRKHFATLALALNPAVADADLDEFSKLYKWRNDLAHGNRKLAPHEAPDEETFELLHRYLGVLK